MFSCRMANRAAKVFSLPGISKDTRSFVYNQSWFLSRFLCISSESLTVPSFPTCARHEAVDFGDVNLCRSSGVLDPIQTDSVSEMTVKREGSHEENWDYKGRLNH